MIRQVTASLFLLNLLTACEPTQQAVGSGSAYEDARIIAPLVQPKLNFSEADVAKDARKFMQSNSAIRNAPPAMKCFADKGLYEYVATQHILATRAQIINETATIWSNQYSAKQLQKVRQFVASPVFQKVNKPEYVEKYKKVKVTLRKLRAAGELTDDELGYYLVQLQDPEIQNFMQTSAVAQQKAVERNKATQADSKKYINQFIQKNPDAILECEDKA